MQRYTEIAESIHVYGLIDFPVDIEEELNLQFPMYHLIKNVKASNLVLSIKSESKSLTLKKHSCQEHRENVNGASVDNKPYNRGKLGHCSTNEPANKLQCFFISTINWKVSSKNLTRTRTQTLELKNNKPLKNGLIENTGTQVRKALPFFSSQMKGNAKVIHFHIKSRGEEGLFFYLENDEVGIKTTIADLQPLLV